jgi:4-amino-4-deoxy-L-arabinose transferase-like glycosyltransferase
MTPLLFLFFQHQDLFLKSSVTGKPDVTQLLFNTGGLFSLALYASTKAPRWLVIGSFCAGLAFSNKFAGPDVILFLWIVAFIHFVRGEAVFILQPEQSRGWIAGILTATAVLVCISGILVPAETMTTFLTIKTLPVSEGRNNILTGEAYRQFALVAGGIMLFIGILLTSPFIKIPLRLLAFLEKCAFSVVTFGVTVLVTSPYLFFDARLLKAFYFSAVRTGYGHFYKETATMSQWFQLLSDVVGLPFIIIFGMGAVTIVVNAVVKKDARKERGLVFVLCWLLLGWIFISGRATRGAHYMMPLFPAFALIAAYGVVTLPQTLLLFFENTRLSQWRWTTNMIGLTPAFVILCFGLGSFWSRANSFIESRVYPEKTHSRVAAGLWIKEHYPNRDIKIYYDSETYVPKEFPNVAAAWGGTEEIIQRFNPELIAASRMLIDAYSDAARAESAVEGAESYKARFEFYRRLFSGELGYKKVKEFREIVVFQKE